MFLLEKISGKDNKQLSGVKRKLSQHNSIEENEANISSSMLF